MIRTPLVSLLLSLVFIIPFKVFSQDLTIPNNPYEVATPEVKERNAFKRERWFNEQRMYPNNFIPEGVYQKAIEQRNQLREKQGFYSSITGEKAVNVSSWKSIGPTPGNYSSYGNISSRITTIQYDPINPNIIYLGAAFGGIWKSTDGGNNWTPKTDNEVSLSSGSIAIDPTNTNIIYYGTGEATYSAVSYYGRGLLKSTNGGETWINYTSGLPSSSYTSRLVIRPNYPNQLLAAMGTSGLYRSTNAGLSWTQLISGRCDDVVFSPTGDTAYIVGSGVSYRISTNGGASFTTSAALTMGTRNHIAICKSYPNVLYFSKYSSSSITLFKSTDAGNSFTQIAVGTDFAGSQAWYDFYMHVNPFDHNYAYVGSIDIWRTTNGGTSFQNITNGYSGGSVHVDQHNLAFHPTNSNHMICVNDGGVWRSTNRGDTWTNLNASLTLTQFYRIATDPNNGNHVLGGTQDNGTQRTLGTMNFNLAFGGDGGEVCFHSQNSNYILGETQNNGVRRSTNNGVSWASAVTGLSGTGAWVGPIISHPTDAGIFYTARSRVFQSANWGSSWLAVSDSLGTIRELAISKSSPNIIYATSGSNIFKSTNSGVNFTNITSGLPVRTITSVYVHPDSANVVLVTFSGFGTGHLYKSTNGGLNWQNMSGNLPDSPANDVLILALSNLTLYLAATDVGVFVTENYGQSWIELADGLPNTVAMHLDYNKASKEIFIGTHGRGIFKTNLLPKLNLTVLIEGLFNSTTNLMTTDTVMVYLAKSFTPYDKIDSAKIYLNATGNGTSIFSKAVWDSNYFIIIKHRNSIETWSASSQKFNALENTYDFSADVSKAYGNNLVKRGNKWCIYSGDINQDGYVNSTDLMLINGDAFDFSSGYLPSDLTGDNFIDLHDLVICDNNVFNSVEVKKPLIESLKDVQNLSRETEKIIK